jgi:hypothetical protein
LDLEGVEGDGALGNDEPKEASDGDIKYSLEGLQAYTVLMTPMKDDP